MSHRKSDLGIPLPYIWLNPSTRPKKLEDMHAAGEISDEEMQTIMKQATDKCYDLVLDLCSPHGADIIDDLKQRDEVPQWDDPEVRIY